MAQSILQLVASGDPAAMQQCIDRYSGLIWTLARRMSGREAEDAVQEVFVALWKSAARFDPQAGSEVAFVGMIARRRLIDRLRSKGRRLDDGANSDANQYQASTATDPLELSFESATAAAALEQLTPEQQLVIGLSIHRGLAHEQIAAATGMPLGTVKTNIRRGLFRVRELLESKTSSPRQEVRQ